MKRKITFLVAFLAVLLVGCAKTTEEKAKPIQTVEFSQLNKADQKKVTVTFGGEFNEDEKHVAVTMTVKNKSDKKIKINPDNFNFAEESKVTPTEGEVTIDPNSKLTKKTIFTTKVLTVIADKVPLTYDGEKFDNGIVTLDNQAEFDTYYTKNKPTFEGDTPDPNAKTQTNKPQTNSNQDNSDMKRKVLTAYLAKNNDSRFTAADYGVGMSEIEGKTIYQVKENHSTPAMKAAGADPQVSPTVANIFINDKGEFEDYFTHTIY